MIVALNGLNRYFTATPSFHHNKHVPAKINLVTGSHSNGGMGATPSVYSLTQSFFEPFRLKGFAVAGTDDSGPKGQNSSPACKEV